MREQGFLFAVKRVNIDYHLPARFNQALTIHSRIVHIGKARLTFDQTVMLDTVCLTSAIIEVACLDAERFKPTAIPQLLREELQRVS
jgi:acyl-CoA thioester hydrolase